jgi:hypothetical protein
MTTLQCAVCGQTSDAGDGWTYIQVTTAPVASLEPLTLQGDSNRPTVVYCDPQHVHAWFTRAGLPPPVPIPPLA